MRDKTHAPIVKRERERETERERDGMEYTNIWSTVGDVTGAEGSDGFIHEGLVKSISKFTCLTYYNIKLLQSL